MSPGRLRHRVGEVIVGRALWGAGDLVTVAVSGGLDSVCLLDLLRVTADWHRGRLRVATVDHGTRPTSSADADWVEDLAATWEIPSTRFDLALGAGASEAACRDARRGALEAEGEGVIALAHHRDDQAETVLLHLLRGAGTGGLAAMTWRHGPWVRPLLGTSRADLEAWAAHRGLSWREDPTNADPRYLRNRLRLEVLPLLEEVRPGAAAALARSASLAASDAALLDDLASRNASPWSVAWLVAAPEPLARRALRAVFPDLEAAHLDAVLAAAHRGKGAVQLPGERVLTVRRGRLALD